jgi:hypothetical protein
MGAKLDPIGSSPPCRSGRSQIGHTDFDGTLSQPCSLPPLSVGLTAV